MQDTTLNRVRELLLGGQRPGRKEPRVKAYMMSNREVSLSKEGCLIVTKLLNNLQRRDLLIVPDRLSSGLLLSLHINLNHPTATQLANVVKTNFFILGLGSKIEKITNSCHLCQSVKQIPEEIHIFQPNETPPHPGHTFTVDVLKTCKKTFSWRLRTSRDSWPPASQSLKRVKIFWTPSLKLSFPSKQPPALWLG